MPSSRLKHLIKENLWFRQLILVVIFASSCCLGMLACYLQYQRELEHLLAEKREALLSDSLQIQDLLVDPAEVLTSLHREPTTVQAISQNGQVNTTALASKLLDISNRHSQFLKVRFIDTRGREVVRVNRKADVPVLVPPENLQDKSNRYFVVDALQLANNQIYVSELDLNVENGLIQVPSIPTIRVATPVFDNNNQRLGALIINIDMSGLFNQLANHQSDTPLFIANHQGQWLLAPNPDKSWGFLRGQSSSLKLEQPQLWAAIQKAERGVFKFDHQLWLWSVTWPLSPSQAIHNHQVVSNAHLVLLYHIGEPQIRALQSRLAKTWWPVIILVSAIIAAAFYGLVKLLATRQSALLRAKQAEELNRALSRARAAEQEAMRFVQANINGIITIDSKARILSANPAAERLFGYPAGGLTGLSMAELIPKKYRFSEDLMGDEGLQPADMMQWVNGRTVYGLKQDGNPIPMQVNVNLMTDKKPYEFAVTIVNLTDRHRAQQKINYLETHDTLTNLPNRSALMTALGDALANSRKHHQYFLLAIVDLDFFKHINDSLGHEYGDQLLKATAERLSAIKGLNTCVYRICGDEFAVFVPGISELETSTAIITTVLSSFHKPFSVGQDKVWLQASAGISVYPLDGKTPEELLRNADSALYRIKQEGRNGFRFYTRDLTEQARKRQRLENDLRKAIKNVELQLAYQPQIDTRTNTLTGIEALLRWQHARLGPISPTEFIPIAEASGLMILIGNWVLLTACRQAKQWLDSGLDFGRVSVNISGSQFNKGGLSNYVLEVLQKTGLPAQCLELEVTESFITNESYTTAVEFKALQEAGVGLAIDDFGTGYSSLSRLKQMPFKALKIDRSFIKDTPEDSNDVAITKAVASIANNLGLEVIAEGVETKAQLDFVKSLGCYKVQGFYFSKPLPPDELFTIYSQQAMKA
ncbi:EAL domain-containing protein [Halioxenophilus sp. WMMB6]|uniref:bifunctional diguanylate cyclase/phosphodiesterase n=1 Tax=Halioxenophilus sp. WMMB6 TaxID=3073815 RepID=UPI00295F177A|nr:EAL domain-containing protein [Halioxenophilus sp. WMMB6]